MNSQLILKSYRSVISTVSQNVNLYNKVIFLTSSCASRVWNISAELVENFHDIIHVKVAYRFCCWWSFLPRSLLTNLDIISLTSEWEALTNRVWCIQFVGSGKNLWYLICNDLMRYLLRRIPSHLGLVANSLL